MKVNWRRYILNFIGVLIFAIVTIVTIIIARGNRIDLQTGELVETGTVRLTTKPEELKAFINEKPKTIREKRIESLDPGSYKLRLEQEGFSSWEGDVEVKAGFITDIVVTLFPVAQKLERITQSNIDQLFVDQNRTSVVYVVTQSSKGSDVGIWRQGLQNDLLNPTNNSARKVSNLNSLTDFVSNGQYQILLSPNGDKLLLSNKDYSQMYLLDTSRYNEPAASNQLKFDYPVGNLSFLDNNTLIANSSNLLLSYSIDSQQSALLYYHPSVAPLYFQFGGTIHWLDALRKNIFVRTNNATTKVSLENVQLPDNITAMHVSSGGEKIILQNNTGIYFIETATSYLKEFAGFKALSISPNGRFILAESNGSVSVIETTDSEVFNEVSHQITTSSLNLKDLNQGKILWSNDSSFFVYHEEDGDIIASDSKGINFTSLIANENNRNQKLTYLLNSTSSSLLAVIQDGVNESLRYNIYQLDL